MSKPQRPHHIPALDGLRGLAVLLVFWAHAPREPFGKLLTTMSIVLQPGYLGVDLFFVLSGFLITRILISERGVKGSLFNFLMRRSLRIFPIYYLTILVLCLVEPGRYLIWCGLYVSNFVFAFDLTPNPMRHTWSLAIEEHFYLVWPFLAHWLTLRNLKRLSIALMVFAIGLACVTVFQTDGAATPADMIYRITFFRILSLAAGSLLALCEQAFVKKTKWIGPLTYGLIGMAFVTVAVGKFLSRGMQPGQVDYLPVAKLIGFAMLSTGIMLWVLAGQDKDSWLRRLLRGSALSHIGRVSYGLYLYHFPIFYYFGLRDTGATAGDTFLAIGVTIAVTIVSYHWLEKPILKIKDRYR